MLFKTNAAQTNLQQQPSSQQITQKSPSDSFSQQFATIGGSSTQSPNNMFMNTYGGSNNQANLSFDLSLGGNPQQFNTSVNPSMMKKKTTPEFQQSANSSDLL